VVNVLRDLISGTKDRYGVPSPTASGVILPRQEKTIPELLQAYSDSPDNSAERRDSSAEIVRIIRSTSPKIKTRASREEILEEKINRMLISSIENPSENNLINNSQQLWALLAVEAKSKNQLTHNYIQNYFRDLDSQGDESKLKALLMERLVSKQLNNPESIKSDDFAVTLSKLVSETNQEVGALFHERHSVTQFTGAEKQSAYDNRQVREHDEQYLNRLQQCLSQDSFSNTILNENSAEVLIKNLKDQEIYKCLNLLKERVLFLPDPMRLRDDQRAYWKNSDRELKRSLKRIEELHQNSNSFETKFTLQLLLCAEAKLGNTDYSKGQEALIKLIRNYSDDQIKLSEDVLALETRLDIQNLGKVNLDAAEEIHEKTEILKSVFDQTGFNINYDKYLNKMPESVLDQMLTTLAQGIRHPKHLLNSPFGADDIIDESNLKPSGLNPSKIIGGIRQKAAPDWSFPGGVPFNIPLYGSRSVLQILGSGMNWLIQHTPHHLPHDLEHISRERKLQRIEAFLSSPTVNSENLKKFDQLLFSEIMSGAESDRLKTKTESQLTVKELFSDIKLYADANRNNNNEAVDIFCEAFNASKLSSVTGSNLEQELVAKKRQIEEQAHSYKLLMTKSLPELINNLRTADASGNAYSSLSKLLLEPLFTKNELGKFGFEALVDFGGSSKEASQIQYQSNAQNNAHAIQADYRNKASGQVSSLDEQIRSLLANHLGNYPIHNILVSPTVAKSQSDSDKRLYQKLIGSLSQSENAEGQIAKMLLKNFQTQTGVAFNSYPQQQKYEIEQEGIELYYRLILGEINKGDKGLFNDSVSSSFGIGRLVSQNKDKLAERIEQYLNLREAKRENLHAADLRNLATDRTEGSFNSKYYSGLEAITSDIINLVPPEETGILEPLLSHSSALKEEIDGLNNLPAQSKNYDRLSLLEHFSIFLNTLISVINQN
jgi:hypothetical protein